MIKQALTVAGTDCSSGAGIQADLKTFAAHNVYCWSVIVSVVAQNTSQVLAAQHITPDMVARQIDAVCADTQVDAVKIGMLPTTPIMETLAAKLRQYALPHIVIDPVMKTTSGYDLMPPGIRNTFIKEILPLADILTPNIPEAAALTGYPIGSPQDMAESARRLHAMGCRHVLIKGGHSQGNAVDLLFDGQTVTTFTAPRLMSKNTHGTGCTLSSAIAANLAQGMPAVPAIGRAKTYLTHAIAQAPDIGRGHGPLNHFYAFDPCPCAGYTKPSVDYTLCLITDQTLMSTSTLEQAVANAIQGGCTLIQLREKTASTRAFLATARSIRALTQNHGIPLIINDRADIALAVHADGLHVGQKDLPAAEARAILGPGKILGVTVHSLEEALAAQASGADYLGVGALFATSSKPGTTVISLTELERIRQHISLPLVAIGGLSPQTLLHLYEQDADRLIDGLAAISAIIAQPDIAQAACQMKTLIQQRKGLSL